MASGEPKAPEIARASLPPTWQALQGKIMDKNIPIDILVERIGELQGRITTAKSSISRAQKQIELDERDTARYEKEITDLKEAIALICK